MEISAKDIAHLRKITGAGMMDCKNALTQTNGNIEEAIKEIRKKGQKVAANRSDRNANEGFVISGTSEDKRIGAIFSLNCETDFVAKNEEFIKFAKDVLKIALNNQIASLDLLLKAKIGNDVIENKVIDLTGKIGEKIEISNYKIFKDEIVFSYNHFTNKLSSIVSFNKTNNLGEEIAMHIAAMNPISIDENGISPSILETEKEVIIQQLKNEGTDPSKIDMILKGKLSKFLKESCLLSQGFVKNEKQTVENVLLTTDKTLKVTNFFRVFIG